MNQTYETGITIVQQRLQWFKEYERIGNAKEVCRRFGISRKTFYKWLNRFVADGQNPLSLLDHTRRPHRSPRKTSESVKQIVLEVRRTTSFGPRRIRRILRDQHSVVLSERTIWKIIKNDRVDFRSDDRPEIPLRRNSEPQLAPTVAINEII